MKRFLLLSYWLARVRIPFPRHVCFGLIPALLAAAPVLNAQSDTVPPLTLEDVVLTTLAEAPDIAAVTWEVERTRGVLRHAQGAFDPQLRAGIATGRERELLGETEEARRALSSKVGYRVGVEHLLRSGLVLQPQLSVTRADGGGLAGDAPYSRTDAHATVMLPLQQGGGGSLVRAGERAAMEMREASSASLRHRTAESVRRSAVAYWDYLAATRRLTVLAEAEMRAAKLLSDTETLIRADERAAVDAIPVRANLASKRAARMGGEQELLQVRLALAIAMGLPARDLSELPPPGAEFPALADATVEEGWAEALVERARRTRWDLVAAERHRNAMRVLLDGARNAERPQLDLRLAVGVSNVEVGPNPRTLVSPLPDARSGLHAELDLSYGIPLGNRAARGQSLQHTAALAGMQMEVDELNRAIALEVLTAAATFRSAQAELRQAEEATQLHRAAVDAEQQKFRLGSATLFDVIFAEDALTTAILREIDARNRGAGALTRLQFQTGALDAEGVAGWARALTTLQHR